MQVHDLKTPKGSRKTKRIVGRGRGSGRGKTSGRGQTGQKSRSGRGIIGSLEGGQMPLIRRLPKVGFRSKRPTIYHLVNVRSLSDFKAGSKVTAQLLKEKGLIKNIFKPFKVLGTGDIKEALTVEAYSFSKSAEKKITEAGGKVKVIDQQSLKKEQQKSAAKGKT